MSDTHAIIAIVERGKADVVVDKAKQAGAGGATILYGRGTATDEFKRMFKHLHVESSKEIIIIIVRGKKLPQILDAVVQAGRLKEPGTGIAFTIDVSNLVGLGYRASQET